MRSKIADKILSETSDAIRLYVDKHADLVVLIEEILRDQDISRKDLASRLDKSPSEVTKWLNGDHNFTLKSICKLEAELGETLMFIPRVQRYVNVNNQKLSMRIVKIPKVSYKGNYQQVDVINETEYGQAS